jgi:alpha-L-fucosidase 2
MQVSDALPGIREWISQYGTGNVTALYGSADDYGSYQTLGNLTVDLSLGANPSISSYNMSLDFENALYTSQWMTDNVLYVR